MPNISFIKENNFVFVFFLILSFFHVLLNNLMSVLKKNPAKQFTSNKQNKPTFLKTELNTVYCKSFGYKI